MNKSLFILTILSIALVAPAISLIAPVNAAHTMHATVSPMYSGGVYWEMKNFTVYLDSGSPIVIVLVVIPPVDQGDNDFRPVDYIVTTPFHPGTTWTARYDAGLRQITFEAPDDTQGIGTTGPEYAYFAINFTKGPTHERAYEWTLSTTDTHKEGHTVYLLEMIDRTKPFVRIDYPKDGSVVNGIIVDVAHSYTMIYVTAYDLPIGNSSDPATYSATGSGIDVAIQIDGGSWIDINTTYNKVTKQYSYQANDLAEAVHTVVAKATDGAGNWAIDTSTFTYRLVIPQVTVGPTTTYDAVNDIAVGSIYETIGTRYTFAWMNAPLAPTLPIDPGAQVDVLIYLPTYSSWATAHLSLGYWVRVAKATTNSSGGGSATFIFPTTPNGKYVLMAQQISNPNKHSELGIVKVIPGMVLEPGTVIGQAFINVTATGLTANSMWASGAPGPALVCNDTDALLGANYDLVSQQWSTNGNGTLSTGISSSDHYVNTAFTMPVLQPGTHSITLTVGRNGNYGNYWNGMIWQPKYCEISGSINVVNTLGLLVDIKADTAYIRTATDTITATLNQLSPVITRIDGNVVTINTTVGSIKATLDQLSPVITRIDGNVVTINTTVGSIKATLDQLSPVITRIDGNVVTINTTLGPMSTTLNAINATISKIDWTGLATVSTILGPMNTTITGISGNVVSIKANTDTIPGISSNVTSVKANTDKIPDVKTNADNIPGLTTPIYIAVVLSLIAAIAAIAGAFLIYRKTA